MTKYMPITIPADEPPAALRVDAGPLVAHAVGKSTGVHAILLALVVVLAVAARLSTGLFAPLWFDENFTAVIASQPDGAAWLNWSLHELSGPVYYGLMWLWQMVAGNSDLALRLPSLAASFAAPMLVYYAGHADRRVRMLWALALALSVPMFEPASSARPYALLALLMTAQAVLFLRLMDAPTRRNAVYWVLVSVAAVLTHYHAIPLTGLMGLAYLGWWRMRAVATWPALFALLPLLVWMPVHLPVLMLVTQPANAWYSVLPTDAITSFPFQLLGPERATLFLLALLVVGWLAAWRRPVPTDAPQRERALPSPWIMPLLAVTAAAIVFALGFVLPSYSPRYVLPAIPAALFGLVLWEQHVRRAIPRAALFLGMAMGMMATTATIDQLRTELAQGSVRYVFNLEEPSDWFVQNGITRIAFLWDNPTGAVSDRARMGEVAGFFMRRSGRPVAVEVAAPKGDEDRSRLLSRLSGAAPGSAILWVYDTQVPGTSAARVPPHIEQIDPRWRCRNFGAQPIATLGCIYQPQP